MAGTYWRLNFLVHCSNILTLALPPLFHHFHLWSLHLAFCAEKRSLIFLSKFKPSNFNTRKVWFLFPDCLATYDFIVCNMIIPAWDCSWFLHFSVRSFLLFMLRVSVFWVSSDAIESRRLPPLKFLLSFPSESNSASTSSSSSALPSTSVPPLLPLSMSLYTAGLWRTF